MRYSQLLERSPTHPRFSEWFKGSKVIDEQGEPLRVFHGTNRVFELPFKEFTYFGTAKAANTRIKGRLGRGFSIDSARLYPCFLCIRHPYTFKDTGMDGNWDVLQAMYQDRIIKTPPNPVEEEDIVYTDAVKRKEEKYIIEVLLNRDYDGIQFFNRSEDRGSTSWVPFSNEQIWPEFYNF